MIIKRAGNIEGCHRYIYLAICSKARKDGYELHAQEFHIDFLICAVAFRLKSEIFTTDNDFSYYEITYTNTAIQNVKAAKNN